VHGRYFFAPIFPHLSLPCEWCLSVVPDGRFGADKLGYGSAMLELEEATFFSFVFFFHCRVQIYITGSLVTLATCGMEFTTDLIA
jgi:hypothetical protein